jgi:hypothetical protein
MGREMDVDMVDGLTGHQCGFLATGMDKFTLKTPKQNVVI